MLATSLILSMASSAFECPEGLVARDSKLDLFHVHDFNLDSGKDKQVGAKRIHEQVSRLFASLDSEFNKKAAYTIVSPMDKSDSWKKDQLAFSCGKALVRGGTIDSEDPAKNQALETALDALSDPLNYAVSDKRTNIFDAAYHQMNQWSKQGHSTDQGTKTIKIMSISTSACPYVSENWEHIPTKLQMLWANKRYIPLELPANVVMCSAHDYPRDTEMATIASDQDIIVVMMVNADKDAICQESEFYPDEKDLVSQWWLKGFGSELSDAGALGVGYDATQEDKFPDFLSDLNKQITSLVCYDPKATTTTSSTKSQGPVTGPIVGATNTVTISPSPSTTGTETTGSTTTGTGTGLTTTGSPTTTGYTTTSTAGTGTDSTTTVTGSTTTGSDTGSTTTGTGSTTTATGTGVVMTTTGTATYTTITGSVTGNTQMPPTGSTTTGTGSTTTGTDSTTSGTGSTTTATYTTITSSVTGNTQMPPTATTTTGTGSTTITDSSSSKPAGWMVKKDGQST